MTKKEVSYIFFDQLYHPHFHSKMVISLLVLILIDVFPVSDLKRQYQTLNDGTDGRNNHSSDGTTDISGHVAGGNDVNVPGSAFHIGPNEDMGQVRLGQQGNYHVTNTTNKEW